jgi:hypothetical protein
MWSLADNIPLIAQDYPDDVKMSRKYRDYHFNWMIPYTHLRTSRSLLFKNLDRNHFKDDKGLWMMSGADNPLFYALIEQADPNRIYCNKEIIVNYNDINPLNDYKIRGEEQNKNANLSYSSTNSKLENENSPSIKRILIAIPTNKNIETKTCHSLWNLETPEGCKLDIEYFFGYSRIQIKNLIAEYSKSYDFTLFVDNGAILQKDTIELCLKERADLVVIDELAFMIANSLVVEKMKYPWFELKNSAKTEIEYFIGKAKNSNANVSYLNTNNISNCNEVLNEKNITSHSDNAVY